MAETKAVVIKYQARDGQDITLSFDTIRRYLVQGKSEYVTAQELMFFCGVCKSQGMNPFNRDCWLIKYSEKDAAAIISAIGFLRSRAKAMKDCRGWQVGIIVNRGKEIIYSDGLMLTGDTLLGGWARGKPEGWEKEVVKEVNLSGYIKKRADGQITRFWQPENQPTQIAKVAESQLLRTLWPGEFKDLYTDAEISPSDDAVAALPDIPTEEEADSSSDAPGHLVDKFDLKVSEKQTNLEHVSEYLALCATTKAGLTIDDVKASAIRQGFESFWEFYENWLKNEKKADEPAHMEPIDDKKKKPEQSFAQQFINLKKGDAVKSGLVPAIMKNKAAIQAAPREDQEIIRKKFYTLYGPEVSYPLDPPGESKTEVVEEDKAADVDDPQEQKKVLELADGAELADLGGEPGVVVTCPNTDDKPAAKWCIGSCRQREGCPTWTKYDSPPTARGNLFA